MAAAPTPVPIPAQTWVNLYVATGIAVGTQINVQNQSFNQVMRVCDSTATPTTEGSVLVKPLGWTQSDDTPDGAWAWCSSDATAYVEEV